MTSLTEQDEKLFARAYKLFGEKQYDKASVVLELALEQSPENPWAHALMGLCLSAGDEFEKAQEETRLAVNLGPRISFTHYCRANVLDDLELHYEALISIRQAIKLQPEEATYYSELAIIYLQQQRWADAIDAASRGLEVTPDDRDCREIRRQALTQYEMQTGSTMPKVSDTMRRITLNADLSSDRGWVELCNRNYKQAKRHFFDALMLDHSHVRAQKGLLRIICQQRPVWGGILNVLSAVRDSRRDGIVICLLMLLCAGAYLFFFDYGLPYTLLLLLPGLFGLLPFLIAPPMIAFVLRPRLPDYKDKDKAGS